MATSKVQSLSVLLRRSTIEDHEEILESCNAALKQSRNDIRAQHVKAIALLKLDRYEDTLRVIEEGGDVLKTRASLEYAYALYKCGKLSDAADVAARLYTGRGAKHVEAQANYRAENFDRTAEIYEELLSDERSNNETNDLRINAWATDAQLLWKRQAKHTRNRRPTREDLEAFETTFNAACASLAQGDLNQGELLLRRAKELCKNTDDLIPEEKAAELLSITIQELYVFLKKGELEKASDIATAISTEDISEPSTKKIAQNNLALVGPNRENPYLLHKRFHEVPTPTKGDKLFDFQQNTLTSNYYALDLLVQKYRGMSRSISKELTRRPYPSTSADDNVLSVYNAAAWARAESGQKALKDILQLLERRPKDVGLVLTVIQLYISIANIIGAISILEDFLRLLEQSSSELDQNVRYNPGLVSVLVSLYRIEGRKQQIKSELAKAASHWYQRPDRPSRLLRAAAASLLDSSDCSEVIISQELFDDLHHQNPLDISATAGYVASHATTNTVEIESALESLPPVHELISGIDVTALEKMGVAQSPSGVAAGLAGTRKRAAKGTSDKANKRIRKSRFPKDYDPNKAPDPERWLPLPDRSTYRPKGKKGKQRAAERTQGGAVNEKAEESIAASVGQQQKGSGGGASSKKKKGRR